MTCLCGQEICWRCGKDYVKHGRRGHSYKLFPPPSELKYCCNNSKQNMKRVGAVIVGVPVGGAAIALGAAGIVIYGSAAALKYGGITIYKGAKRLKKALRRRDGNHGSQDVCHRTKVIELFESV